MDLRGGSVLEAIPTVGLSSTIACSYLVSSFGLDQISALESDEFPPISMIYSKKPKFPARIYASEKLKLAVFISEVPLPANLHRSLARTLLDWTRDQGCQEIICMEGLSVSDGGNRPLRIWGVGSTDRAREKLGTSGIEQLETGMISGVSGVLLNEGRWVKFDVISLLAETRPYMPDALAAAKLVEGIDRLLPQLSVPTEPLYEQAEVIQAHMATLREQAKPAIEGLVEMYR
ncbi:MAG: proteasome assembly chaperone family protein [Thermoplasmata archaeon]